MRIEINPNTVVDRDCHPLGIGDSRKMLHELSQMAQDSELAPMAVSILEWYAKKIQAEEPGSPLAEVFEQRYLKDFTEHKSTTPKV